MVAGIQRSGEAVKGNTTVNGGEEDGGGYIQCLVEAEPEVFVHSNRSL